MYKTQADCGNVIATRAGGLVPSILSVLAWTYIHTCVLMLVDMCVSVFLYLYV